MANTDRAVRYVKIHGCQFISDQVLNCVLNAMIAYRLHTLGGGW